MFNKYAVLIIDFIDAIYATATNASDICSCSSRDCDQFNPICQEIVIHP